MKIAVQLYSIRQTIEKEGLENVLSKIKQIGYDGIEFYTFYDLAEKKLKNMLDKYGLSSASAHCSFDLLLNETDKLISYAKALGMKTLVNPGCSIDRLENDYNGVISGMSRILERLKAAGISFAYHNHAHELGKTDYLKKMCADLPGLKLQPDTFWVRAAGYDPYEYAEKIIDKIEFFHIKELSEKGIHEANPVPGQGISSTPQIVALAKRRKMEWLILEAEKFDTDEWEYLEKSYKALSKM